MQVHEPPGVFFNLPSVHKPARELDSVLDVSGAAPPLPALLLVVVALLFAVAAALAKVALAACRGHGVGHAGCSDGVRERCLPAA